MKITDDKTAYEVKKKQLNGQLEEQDYKLALTIYERKIRFLRGCLKGASRLDAIAIREYLSRFETVRDELRKWEMKRKCRVVLSMLKLK